MSPIRRATNGRQVRTTLLVLLALLVPPPAHAGPTVESATIAEVSFENPRKEPDGSRALDGVRVQVAGDGLQQKATGPVVLVNGIATRMVRVARDGRSLEALYYLPLADLRTESGWRVEVEPHAGAPRLPVPGEITVETLSTAERSAVESRKSALGIR